MPDTTAPAPCPDGDLCTHPLPWDGTDSSVELLTGQLTVAVPAEQLELC